MYVTSRSARENRDNITYIKGNAHDDNFLVSLLKDGEWDAVVDFMVYGTDEFQQRHKLLLSSTKQYVFISSARVYAETCGLITEDSPRLLDVCTDKTYLASDEYALTKARQEDLLKNYGQNNWTIIRPYITFSEQRLQLSPAEKEQWLYWALLADKTIVFSHDLADRFTTLTYGRDVARGIAAVIGNENAYGQAFHITSDESYRWRDILDTYLRTISRKIGRELKVQYLDHWQPLVGGGELQVKWDRLYDRRFDNSKIKQYIDTTTFKPTLSALSDCMSDFLDHPQFSSVNWGYQAQRDKLNGDWSNILKINGAKQRLKYVLVRLGLYR